MTSTVMSATLEQRIAQKIMLDFRYSEDANGKLQGVTQLTQWQRELLTELPPAGVILFSENITSLEQVSALNQSIQAQAPKGLPFFIATDQEGGRVARLPRAQTPSYAGNMAMGATYQTHGTDYATKVYAALAEPLKATGFNVNFAPTVDVNNNPDNPVINIRSFGESAKEVAALGLAASHALEDSGVLSAIKHFPGHGDTHTDSHTGLPLVSKSKAELIQTELYPFQHIIASHQPSMVMTAHMQFPALDNTTLVNKAGQTMVRPATMSHKILTELLRQEFGYSGLIITDALDMKGISDFFTPSQAVIETFKAGADIALMPIALRSQDDLKAYRALIKDVAKAVERGELSEKDLTTSYDRIRITKASLHHNASAPKPSHTTPDALKLHNALLHDAITLVHNDGVLPLKPEQTVFVAMPDPRLCSAMQHGLHKAGLSKSHCHSLLNELDKDTHNQLSHSDVLLIGSIQPKPSPVELGGVEDWQALKAAMAQQVHVPKRIHALIKHAQSAQVPVIYTALRAPYELAEIKDVTNASIATYSYQVEQSEQGAVFDVLAQKLISNDFQGTLPVSIKAKP